VNERGRIVVDRHRQTQQRGSNVYQQRSDVVARRFFLAKVARVVSFCAEHGAFLARRVLNASFNHRHHYQPSVLFFHDVHGFQSRQIGSSLSARPPLPVSVSLFHTYAVRVEWSRLALASFPLSAFGAPFASSCHRSLLPPASYKDAGGNLFILASRNGMPRSSEETASARLPTRRCSVRNTAESALAIFHGHLPAWVLSRSLILRRLGLAFPFRRALVAKFSPLTLSLEHSAFREGPAATAQVGPGVERSNLVDYKHR